MGDDGSPAGALDEILREIVENGGAIYERNDPPYKALESAVGTAVDDLPMHDDVLQTEIDDAKRALTVELVKFLPDDTGSNNAARMQAIERENHAAHGRRQLEHVRQKLNELHEAVSGMNETSWQMLRESSDVESFESAIEEYQEAVDGAIDRLSEYSPPKGRPSKWYGEEGVVAGHAGQVFERLTGRRPDRNYAEPRSRTYGIFVTFLSRLFAAADIQASSAHMARCVIDDMEKNRGGGGE